MKHGKVRTKKKHKRNSRDKLCKYISNHNQYEWTQFSPSLPKNFSGWIKEKQTEIKENKQRNETESRDVLLSKIYLKQKFEHKRMGKDVPDKYKTLLFARLPKYWCSFINSGQEALLVTKRVLFNGKELILLGKQF